MPEAHSPLSALSDERAFQCPLARKPSATFAVAILPSILRLQLRRSRTTRLGGELRTMFVHEATEGVRLARRQLTQHPSHTRLRKAPLVRDVVARAREDARGKPRQDFALRGEV